MVIHLLSGVLCVCVVELAAVTASRRATTVSATAAAESRDPHVDQLLDDSVNITDGHTETTAAARASLTAPSLLTSLAYVSFYLLSIVVSVSYKPS